MKILIADDFPLILEGLEKFLREHGYTDIVTATNGTDALSKIGNHQPEIAILDMEMPHLNGLEVAEICKKKNARCRIVFLTYRLDSFLFSRCTEAGVVGYLLKDEPLSEVLECIRHVKEGKAYYSSRILNIPEEASQEYKNFMLLSPSEKKILLLISEGLSSQDIADRLSISFRTVEKHRSNIIHKLNLDSRRQKLAEWVIINRKLLD